MRRGTPIWAGLCTLALLWPSCLSGPLDGVPLDNTLELIALGIVAPAFCWFRPRFLTTWPARSCVLAPLVMKAAGAIVLVPEGWCAAVDPARPYVRDQTSRPHAWDLRADWWRTNPSCTALMTRSCGALTEFPVWGRFSIHIIGAMTALLVGAVAQCLDAARSALRPPAPTASDAIRT